MSVIRVNPESVRQYAVSAGEGFAAARTQLEQMVKEAVEVHYFGENAFQFKTRCGELAADYSNRLLQDFTQIAAAVGASTGNIAASLGGQPIQVPVNGQPIVPPPAQAPDGTYDVDVSALRALQPVIKQHVAAVHTALGDHLTSLTNTDWQGTAKTSAVESVTRFTTLAQNKASEAETQIVGYIEAQITSVVAADR